MTVLLLSIYIFLNSSYFFPSYFFYISYFLSLSILPPRALLLQPVAALPTPPAPPPSSSSSCRGSSAYAVSNSAPRPPRPRAPAVVLRRASSSCPGPSTPAAGRLLHLKPTPQASADGRCCLLRCGPPLPSLPPRAGRREEAQRARGQRWQARWRSP